MRRVASFAVLLVLAVPAVSGDAEPLPPPKISKGLEQLFKVRSEAVTTKSGMLVAEPAPDVLVARLNEKGKVETECVASLEAATRFIKAARANDAPTGKPEK